MAQGLVKMLQPTALELVLRPKIAKQFEEAQGDLQMLLRLFSTYVADLLPKHPQPPVVNSDIDGKETVPHDGEEPHDKEPSLVERNKDMENVSTIPVAGETEVVAVVGMAGIGKTALARAVFRAAEEGFDYLLWAHVTQDFDPERIFRGLMTSLSKKLQHGEDPESYWWSMKEGLINKKYLVVLDDVWNEDPRKWNQLLHLLRGNKTLGSKIVVTTRIPAAAAAIQSARTHNLLPLTIEDSQKLLKTASGSEGSIIRKVAERCRGLPKLVDIMKTVLEKYNCSREAMHAVEEFDRQCRDHKGLLDTAKASYEHLPSHLRRCFLYCSLFPLDHIFDAEEMTALWVAEGLSQVSSRESQVDCHFSKLLDECFYESGSREKMRYTMQFILHNFARNIGQDRYRTIEIKNYASLREQSIRYMSLMVDRTTKELPELLIEQKDLRTLILHRRQEMVLCCQRSEIREIPSDYCRYLTALRVLDLHSTKIDKLPDDFVMLSNLRYLNLSQTDIAELPESFDKLQYLIYLNIAQTCIAEVPESIGNIKFLRYLNLSQTGVRKLPDTIGKLRSLQTLQLSQCKKLVKVPRNIAYLTSLQKLDLEGCHYLSEMPQDIGRMKNLKELNILECSSLDRMPFGLSKLTKIEALPRYIAMIGNEGTILELQGLRNLKILGLQNLERVSLMDSEEKLLEGKNKLKSLTLHWNIRVEKSTAEAGPVQPNQGNSISDVEQLIGSLQPNRELKTLEIISYGGKKFPDWMTNSLPNLVEIRLVNVKCERLPPLGKLPLLAVAEISGMDAMNHVSSQPNGEDMELNGEDMAFPSLKKLTFSQMFNLESWPTEGFTCPCLEELSIIQCPKFRKLSKKLPIKKLTLWMSPHELLAKEGLAGVATSLKSLSISLCEELSSSSNIEGLTALSCLEELQISGCDELESLPLAVGNLTSVKSLSLIGCSKLHDVSGLEKWISQGSLQISGCPKLQSWE